ncbi:MAG: tetratricopeptide repeat protein [Okeania sp. SIO3B3]|nr:tetratricopeptide repeat protein [Okeania sp. SIO3B3]
MKHIIKLTIILTTLTMVSCGQKAVQKQQPSPPSQPTLTATKSGTPKNIIALNRLAKRTVVEIVSESFLTGDDKYIREASGVIIGKKDSTYYVLTANHISDSDDGLFVVTRSEKPGKRGEVQPLKFIKRYPKEDLAVVAFASLTDYEVAVVGEASLLDDGDGVYVGGWPGAEDSEGFQFTPALVTNPRAGNNLNYQPTVPGEDVSEGMSGGAVLNEAGQLVAIHVGLTRFGGDGDGVLISTFLRMVPSEVEEVLVRGTPVASKSRKRENQTPRISGNATPSPTKKAVLTRNSISTATNIYEVRTFNKTSLHTDNVWSLAISPDGQTIVTGSGDNTIKVWDMATGNLKATLSGHTSWIRSVAISPDGQTIVSGSYDKTIKVWDMAKGNLKATLSGHTDNVNSVAISPDGQTIVSGSDDKTIKVWDLGTGNLKAIIFGHSNQQHLQIAGEIGDRSEEGRALGNLGNAYWSLGEYEKAIEYHQQHLQIARKISDRSEEGRALGSLGMPYFSLGEYEKAIEYYQQHLQIAREIGDRSGESITLGNLGMPYHFLGEYEKAIEYHQQSLQIAREIGNRSGEGRALGNLGVTYKSQGEYEKAIEYHHQSLQIAREIGNRSGESIVLGNLGNAYHSLGEYEKVIEYHHQSLQIAREIGDRPGEGRTLGNLGNAYFFLEEYDKAIEYYRQDLQISREIGNRSEEGIVQLNWGETLLKLEKYAESLEYSQAALGIFQQIGNPHHQAIALKNIAATHQHLGNLDAARQYCDEALAIFTELGVPELKECQELREKLGARH